MAVFGEPFVTVMYGDKFIGTGFLFSILVISYLPACIVNPAWPLAIALGRTDLSLYFTIIKLAIALPLIYFAAQISLIAVAIAFIILSIVSFIVSYLMMVRNYTGLSFIDYCRSFSTNAVFSIVTGLLSFAILTLNPFHFTSAISLLLVYGSIAGFFCLLSACMLLKKDSELYYFVPSKIKRFIK